MGIIDKEMNFKIIDTISSISKLPKVDQSFAYLKENNPVILAK